MDPPPPPAPPSTAVGSLLDLPALPSTTTTTKLRLLCSYGGHIIHRPNSGALRYSGGENRVVAVDRRTTAASLHALTAHLSRAIYNDHRAFHIKYQLPNEDLDSLISVTTDEDLINLLEEHDSSSGSSRIRLFLFPVVKPEPSSSLLGDSKAADCWFSDALNSARSADPGFGSDPGRVENPGDAKESVPESMVLETSSSFGSTSSSISMSNLPAIVAQSEDVVAAPNLGDKRVKPASSASVESDNSVGSSGFQPKAGIHQDPLVQVVSSMGSQSLVEAEGSMANPSLINTPKAVQVSGYQLPQMIDGKQPQHGLQYFQGGACYIPQYPSGPLPVSSCSPFYQVPMQQPQQSPYPLSQQYPVYLVPVQQMQSHSISVQPNISHSVIATNRPPLHLQSVMTHPSMAYKEVMAAQPVPESGSKVYTPVPAATPSTSVPSQTQQHYTAPPEPQLSSQPIVTASVPAATDANEFEDDLAYSQIYKSQPPPPAFISQCQTITKGATVLLSESSMQLHSNNLMNQTPSHLQ